MLTACGATLPVSPGRPIFPGCDDCMRAGRIGCCAAVERTDARKGAGPFRRSLLSPLEWRERHQPWRRLPPRKGAGGIGRRLHCTALQDLKWLRLVLWEIRATLPQRWGAAVHVADRRHGASLPMTQLSWSLTVQARGVDRVDQHGQSR